jgi:hypothetical protein
VLAFYTGKVSAKLGDEMLDPISARPARALS